MDGQNLGEDKEYSLLSLEKIELIVFKIKTIERKRKREKGKGKGKNFILFISFSLFFFLFPFPFSLFVKIEFNLYGLTLTASIAQIIAQWDFLGGEEGFHSVRCFDAETEFLKRALSDDADERRILIVSPLNTKLLELFVDPIVFGDTDEGLRKTLSVLLCDDLQTLGGVLDHTFVDRNFNGVVFAVMHFK